MKKAAKKKTVAAAGSVWHKIVSALLAWVNIAVAIGLLASAYAGAIDPSSHPTASVVALTFHLWLAAAIVCVTATAFLRWKIALISVAALVAALPSVLSYSPFRLPHHADPDATTFTLMSYNVYGRVDQRGEYPGDVNPTLSYILCQDPDIVCLQECSGLHPDPITHVTTAQIDSLHSQYPYIYMGSHMQTILSKFPVEPINIGFEYTGVTGSADMACFRVDVHGLKITIFDIHLQSFTLENSDREMFARLRHLKGSDSEIAGMRSHLVNKIRQAAPRRVADTEELLRYIRKFGGPNVIVCGDFNDVPGCYSLRLLHSEKLHEVYPEVGFGPMITYNAGGFNFRIDHILYRGELHPLSMTRGSVASSDHYPVTATFEIAN